MSDNVIDLQRLRMKTLNIGVPEYIYNELYKRHLIKKINEIVVNHFIDILDNWEDRNNENRKDGEEVPELEGMKRKIY